jgi:hypothetical protein
MIWISHRANIQGPDPDRENNLLSILDLLQKNIHVEIDVWHNGKELFLGHDLPNCAFDLNEIEKYKSLVYIHCKNFEALDYFIGSNWNYFFHDADEFTLTSDQKIWTYPNKIVGKNSIIVCKTLEEQKFYKNTDCFGICSDWDVEKF